MRAELTRAQQDLDFGKNQWHSKTEEFQNAVDDLANAHRQSEDARLSAIQELESKKYEVNDLKVTPNKPNKMFHLFVYCFQAQVDSNEQRIQYLQQELIRVDSERETFKDGLARFQSVANRVLTINRFKSEIDPETGDLKDSSNDDTNPSEEHYKSVPFPPSIDFDANAPTSNKEGFVDSKLIDSTLQMLSQRIDQLQRERVRILFPRFIIESNFLRSNIATS